MKKKTNKKQNTWQDHYTRDAKKQNYPARSVFKLEEIQNKFKVLKPGFKVLDLGCAPGSWLLYSAKIIGKKGLVVGIDKKPMSCKIPENAKCYTQDIFEITDEFLNKIGNKFNVVLSDIAPATSGHKDVDAARSYNLCEQAFLLACKVLVINGIFACKIFQGEDFKNFTNIIQNNFKNYKIFKPNSSRKASKEIYVVCFGFSHTKEVSICQDIANGHQ